MMPSTHRPILGARWFTGHVSRCPVLDFLLLQKLSACSLSSVHNFFLMDAYHEFHASLSSYFRTTMWHARLLVYQLYCLRREPRADAHPLSCTPSSSCPASILPNKTAPIRLPFVNCLKRGYADRRPALSVTMMCS